MRINPEEVEKVARLARLSLTREEAVQFSREFDDILDHFAVIDGFSLKQSSEPFTKEEEADFLREDRPQIFEDQEKLHRNGKKMQDGLIVIPRVLE